MKRLILGALAAALVGLSGAEQPQRPTVREALEREGVTLPARTAPRFGPVQNLSCGLPPLPPLGCKVGPCVCDQYGQNCQWTFICR